jgi:signal transduction histidine kinase
LSIIFSKVAHSTMWLKTDPCNRVVESFAEKPSAENELQPIFPESLLVQFEVQDTGIGIRKEKLQDMFNPFTQADASTSRLYGGTGLGLCIVQRYVCFSSIFFFHLQACCSTDIVVIVFDA